MLNLVKREQLRSQQDELLMQKVEDSVPRWFNGEVVVEVRNGKATRLGKEADDLK